MIVYRELSSLVADLGFSARTLYALSNDIENHYRRVSIPKRDGSFRTLSVPDDLLKIVQKAIAKKLLSMEPVSPFAAAYKIGGSIRKNACPHVGKKKVLKLDIRNFFDSMIYSRVKEKAFPESRYSESNRVLLTMLCYYKDILPQGAPTSPAITNIVMRDFDETVGAWCKERNIDYTRYCDDMTFSGDFDSREVVAFVSAELKKMGLFLNKRKTKEALATQRQTVTGVVVNEKLNVPSDYRRQLRKEVYYCRRFGAEAHLKHIGSDMDPKAYLKSLFCRLTFALHVSPGNDQLARDREFIKTLL